MPLDLTREGRSVTESAKMDLDVRNHWTGRLDVEVGRMRLGLEVRECPIAGSPVSVGAGSRNTCLNWDFLLCGNGS